jgi:L-cysteine S-thiosulfotransferase
MMVSRVAVWLVAWLGLGLGFLGTNVLAQAPAPAEAAKVAPAEAVAPPPPINGREIFIDERKGNCAACHKVPNDTAIASQSNIGPALQAVKARFPDRAKLREAIWDYSKLKPTTIMPPYGKHRILTDAEIDALVIYLESI